MEEGDRYLRHKLGALAAVLLAIAAGGWFYAQSLMHPPPVPAPQAFAPYTAPDDAFLCQSPQGWKQESAASHAVMSTVTFKNASARIEITADLQGSLQGDIARATNASLSNLGSFAGAEGAPTPQLRPPVEQLHEKGAKGLRRDLKEHGYGDPAEQPMQTLQTPAGEGRYSEFTAKGGAFQGDTHGYRATILNGDRRISYMGRCRESDWSSLKPSFEKVLLSITRGNG